MVTLSIRQKGKKNYKKVKSFRKYDAAWRYVAESLINSDYLLHYGYALQYLCIGYGKGKVWPYGSTQVCRKGIEYRISLK